MKQYIQAIVYSALFAAFIVASPLFENANSSKILNERGDPTTCPSGWIVGTDKSGAAYCFNCGLPYRDVLGCPAPGKDYGCTNGPCDAYASSVCGPFSGHNIGESSTARKDCPSDTTDPSIFPNPGKTILAEECHKSNKKGEMLASAYAGFPVDDKSGKVFSDACGFLLHSCPTGLHDQAVIYNMGGTGRRPPSQGNRVKNNDFWDYAGFAIKLSKNNPC